MAEHALLNHPKTTVIYIKSCKGLAFWILDMTLFCSFLLDLLQTDGNYIYIIIFLM